MRGCATSGTIGCGHAIATRRDYTSTARYVPVRDTRRGHEISGMPIFDPTRSVYMPNIAGVYMRSRCLQAYKSTGLISASGLHLVVHSLGY